MKRAFPLAFAVLLLTASFRFIPLAGYQPGDAVKDFSLKSVSGKTVSLSSYENAKGAIVIFTCNHCPFSQAYEQRIIDLHKKYADKGYPVIAINPNDKNIVPEDSFDEMVKRAKKYKYPFEYLHDESQSVAMAYGAARTPHVFILQKENDDYITKYIGAIDDNTDDASAATKHYVADAVDALLAGKEVPVKTTKAVGCTIKWKKEN